MAKKIKVAGYSEKTSYNGNIEYRNFSPDLVGVQLASHGGTPLFTMGNFAITTNLDPKIDKNYVTGKFSDFVTLDNLNLSVLETQVLLQNNISTFLNLDTSKLKNYALFGSMTEYMRIVLEEIITKWPASLYASPFVNIDGSDYVGNTYEDYTYDLATNESNFKVNTTFLINQYQINFLTNGTIIDTFNETNDLRNMTMNYGSYAILFNDLEYDVLSFTGSTFEINDYIYFKVKGNPFTGGTSSNIYYHIKPKKVVENTFFNSLTGLGEYLLNRQSLPLYKATFEYPTRTDSGMVLYTTKSLTWPVSDGYNIDFDTSDYTEYATQLLKIATNYDLNETNLMSRFLVSDSISAFDTTPVHLDEAHQDTTTVPTVGTTIKNNISYRQVGSNQWEIAMAFDKLAGQGASAGSGDYLFKLPNSLQFDTTVPWQSQYQGGVGINDTSLTKFTIPSGGGNIGDGAGSSATTFVPVVWDSSNFRILVHIPGSSITCMGSSLFPVTSSIGFTLYFQVTSQN